MPRRVTILTIVLVVVLAFLLPGLRAATTRAPAEPSPPAGDLIFSDQDAIAEANLAWDNPIEKVFIRDAVVVERTPCREPFAGNPVQGTITESRTVQAFSWFGWNFSTIIVDCDGNTSHA